MDRHEVVAVLPLSARFTWKENGETGERDTNARVYSQGFKDPREMPTYTGIPNIHSIYIAIIYMLSKDFSMMKTDVSGAFLQDSPDFPDKKPKELSKFTDEQYKIVKKKRKELKEGEIYIADKALYGGPGLARIFSTKAKTELKELGFEEIDESIHVQRETNTNEVNAVIYHHVDDFKGGAMDIEEIFSKYRHRLSLGSLVRVVDGEVAKFVGIEQMRQGKKMFLSQASFLNLLCIDDLLPEKKHVVREEDMKVSEDDMIDLSLKPCYQSLIGTLGWAVRTQPKVQPFFSILSSRANCISKKLMECLALVLQALKERPFSLELRGIDISTLLLYIFNDSSFFTLSKEGRQAWMHFLVDATWRLESDDEWNLVTCGSKRTKQKFISSTSCEMVSMVDGVKAAYKTRDIAFRLFGKLPRVIVVMDSKPLYDQIESGLARSEPRMQGTLDYLMQEIGGEGLDAQVVWVKRELQRADVLTRAVWW
uniref:Reverse transcriptase Ty1/copia-type domain-containing protein n=2 Tax=Chromera velia CCMP2878 TaxID=1169474 RepID=A0A0K6S964_9ALVE|eukprot:Cvel_27286.t2-p1 / transcript=Cvel_27286.t2 / gene=Cvel_27286 / organism=Chromera_velia_CCMP2878 / gene_product=hypothetical protein / transcript_product=hypothetical protein / location=Cvel_scaffold3381:6807-8296(-) / protein_length=480 / sequence_SO=supercontig / SO=protein_coding / is_pseudo=false